MFGKPIHLFRIFGFDVGIDLSWFLLFMLITWSLAMGLFPFQYPGLAGSTYLMMGVTGALGLFLSIVFHELSHSLVARRFGLTMKGITLFLFGGVAEMPEEPRKPGAEFWMAAAGPASSLVLAAAFLALYRLGQGLEWNGAWTGIIGYLSVVNVALAIFNMVPAFPLDGGRVLRAAIWKATGDPARATRVAASIGAGFGMFLFAFGAVRIISGNLVGGVWWMLIGLFIRSGARSTVTQMNFSRLLKGEKVGGFMNRRPVSVDPAMPVKRLVEDYLYKHNYRNFPVTDGGRLVGCIGIDQVKSLGPHRWEIMRVGEAMSPCPDEAVVDADMPVEQALKRMQESGQSTLLVLEDGRFGGILTTSDILHYLTMRMELEAAERRAPESRAQEEDTRRERPERPGTGEPLPA